ncbi:MAG: VTT domain-containing protein [Acidobacteriota bacterium]
MKRYWLIVSGTLLLFLLLFLLVEALRVPILTDPSSLLNRGGVVAALVGVGLLVADVLLPVPSSLVMVAHGALFGVWLGTLLSLLGSVGAALFGFALGRRGSVWLDKLISPSERARADGLLTRWGALAIVLTRPVPLLAETVMLMAGASPMSWRQALLAAAAGSLPPALLYALTGAIAASFENGALMFGFILLVTGAFWWLSRFLERRPANARKP